ncbi:FRG domain-containing protein [Rhodococcoides yunnanense]|uniref:FRG domain-containing protein n=1 Tax=Rhodococcoides yunnanense TaxID=278209 RepID=UPI0022B099AA|nr:FRG domain-containing protein [Rhodococcus yunnanensis]MCZ4276480.1 FRG domain-containing protein [Rhodococcus yunnanensis]
MTSADRFYSEREINSSLGLGEYDLEQFWNWITGETLLPIASDDAYKGTRQFYRGQPQASYGLTSSLFRLCAQDSRDVNEDDLARAESAILDAMRNEGLGRLMTDGELLMICQHHGIPTRLLDVSTGPLEALFFAIDREDASDGRLFIIAPHGENQPGGQADLKISSSNQLPWHGVVRGTKRVNGDWSTVVRVVNEAPLDPRMRAQAGKFLVGGVFRTWAGMAMPGVPKDDRTRITSMAIQFPKNKTKKPAARWSATGWTVRIHASWKRDLRRMLAEKAGISHDTMYPPVTEVRRLATHVALASLTANL